jgi:transposase
VKATTVGIDLAKNLVQVHGVDERGKPVLRRQFKRNQVLSFFANVTPCVIGMEACCSAHLRARQLQKLGHTVKLMAPQFVKPYVKTNKNDVADAEAICEAVSRPTMRFVPVKNGEQQAVLALHRARQGFVRARTAQANQIRGLLAEYGMIIPQGLCQIGKRLPAILEDGANDLPGLFRGLLQRLGEHLKALDRGQLPTCAGSRHRSNHGKCAGGFHWRCQELRERTPAGCMVRAGSQAALQRRENRAAWHQ